jgi:hypothetical protein
LGFLFALPIDNSISLWYNKYMITKLITTGILLIGITFAINGVTVKADDLLASASSAANRANIYQFRTALDLYYIDHNNYPDVANANEMINILKSENYIIDNSPVKPESFNYQAVNNGQNYLLQLK